MVLRAEFPVESGNAMTNAGTLAAMLQATLAEQTPEAAYLFADQGKRTTLRCGGVRG